MENKNNPQVDGTELIVALVGAIGTDMELVNKALKNALQNVNFTSETLHIIELIHEIPQWKDLPETPWDVRIKEHMDAGNDLRIALGRGDALAALALGAIRQSRENATGDPNCPKSRHAYILRSLKHPEEAHTLSKIYGPRFILVAAYSPREARVHNLAKKIGESHHVFRKSDFLAEAETLIKRDLEEVGQKLGQNVSDTFPLADVFLDVTDPDILQTSIERFIELFFGHPFHTPTRHEYGMFHAKAAALRSSSLARQVGAVISTEEGDIIAVGTNDVPKSGGGLYWCDDKPDHRDFVLGYDSSDKMRQSLLADILKRLKDNEWLSTDIKEKEIDKLVDEALLSGKPPLPPLMKGAHFMNLIEFARAVHAEMAALMDAARRGASVKGAVLYTTTFPCHDCARHIVAAGIKKVVYIEPYPKSLAPELYLDSIVVDKGGNINDQVNFQPFVGVAPKRYMDLFSMSDRKEKDGTIVSWDGFQAKPRLTEHASFHIARLIGEQNEITLFEEQLIAKNLRTTNIGGINE